jgi:hypothetical protein
LLFLNDLVISNTNTTKPENLPHNLAVLDSGLLNFNKLLLPSAGGAHGGAPPLGFAGAWSVMKYQLLP